jgi:hypothetical protein
MSATLDMVPQEQSEEVNKIIVQFAAPVQHNHLPNVEASNRIATMRDRLLSRFIVSLAGALILFLGVAYALRHKPVLFHILAETGCACGEYQEGVTGLIVRNPFRDATPEKSAAKFLEELRDGRCVADPSLCHYALHRGRVSDWRLANRQDRSDRVLLYYKLTPYPETELKHRLSGEGLIEVVRAQSGWAVASYSCYF